MIQQFYFYVYTQRNGNQGLRYLYTSVCGSIIHNSQKMETILIFINIWISRCMYGEFPGGPVVRAPRFHGQGPRFDPPSGN